jgi:hypothetical protein
VTRITARRDTQTRVLMRVISTRIRYTKRGRQRGRR